MKNILNSLKSKKILFILLLVVILIIIISTIIVRNNLKAKEASKYVGVSTNYDEIQSQSGVGEDENILTLENNNEDELVEEELTEEEKKEDDEKTLEENQKEYEKLKSENKVSSSSKYYIKVNYGAQVVTVYTKDSNGKYTKVVKNMVCSTGAATPLSGVYRTTNKYTWRALNGGVYGQYATRIVGSILFHSVPYTKNGDKSSLKYTSYDRLGTKASAGCVRLTVKDAKWIYDNCPLGTQVEFYYSKDTSSKPTAMKISSAPKDVRCWDPTDPDPDNPWPEYLESLENEKKEETQKEESNKNNSTNKDEDKNNNKDNNKDENNNSNKDENKDDNKNNNKDDEDKNNNVDDNKTNDKNENTITNEPNNNKDNQNNTTTNTSGNNNTTNTDITENAINTEETKKDNITDI